MAVAVNAGPCLFAFGIGTARRLTVTEIAPAAVAAAVVWQLLQIFGAAYVGRVVTHAGETDSVFAAAVAAAAAAAPGWAGLAPAERTRLLAGAGERVGGQIGELIRLEAVEMGKPVSAARD